MKQKRTTSRILILFSIHFLFISNNLYAQDPFIMLEKLSEMVDASQGVGWADYNNDGYPDMYVSNGTQSYKQHNLLFLNNTDGTFTQITSGELVTYEAISGGGTWGDFDNDGDLDIYITTNRDNFSDPLYNYLFENNGDGTFTKNTTAGPPVDDGETSASCGWGDYNNDGYIDLFVTNGWMSNEKNSLYSNDGDGTFTKISNIDLVSDDNATPIAGFGWADYDNDGDLDVYVAGGNSQNNFLWRNNGNGDFTKLDIFGAGQSEACSWGDYDNDDDLDLLITNYGDSQTEPEPNWLYRNDGNDVFTKITVGEIATDSSFSRGSAWGDIDNDGDLDLFVSNDGPPNDWQNFLYLNDGSGNLTKITSVVNDSTYAYGAAFADYNKDGFLDLFVCRSACNYLFRNNEIENGNTNHWINIQCVGTVSNWAGIGAKVRVRASINSQNVWQMREISAQTGYGSHNDLRAHFGLGDATIIAELKVEWPSGIVQTLTNVAVDQFLTITEQGGGENIAVTSPNGGESWEVGSTYDITWTSNGISGNVKIEYSADNGSTWQEIIASTTDDGVHPWTIPDDPSTNCLVRVTDTDGDPTDQSDAVFIISQQAFNISGSVVYDGTGRLVSDAIIDLTHGGGTGKDTTDSNGRYQFENVPVGNVTIVPSKTEDWRDAITGSDALLVLQYLAFLTNMNEDQQFAADVTQDGNVTGSDAQAILRYLAFYSDNIGVTGQWRFIPSDSSFTLSADAVVDFEAYLKGDANLDWNEGTGLAKSAVVSKAAIIINQADISDTKNIIVPIKVETAGETINTLVFTLSYDPGKLRYQSTGNTALTEQFMMITNGTESGKVHFVMAGVEGIEGDGDIVRLVFEVVDQAPSIDLEIIRALVNDLEVQDDAKGQINLSNKATAAIPDHFNLDQNYPNPFNPETFISFQLPEARNVILKVYNLLGDEICTLVNEKKEAGYHKITWDGKNKIGREVPSGVYLLTIQAGDFKMNRKMIKIQ